MPRRARSYIPGMPYHLVQRGNNRQACFYHPNDYQDYLDLWKNCSNRYGVLVHAYCLMTNHIHFLATPESESSLSNTMKVVGSRYAQRINRRYKRTGSLWEGRHKSSLVDSDRYLLSCYKYIELNPVRANMVMSPQEYPWSSYRVNVGDQLGWVTPHDTYLSLSDNVYYRHEKYRLLVGQETNAEDVKLIQQASYYCQPVGDDAFCQRIAAQYGLKLGQMKNGRPKKKSA